MSVKGKLRMNINKAKGGSIGLSDPMLVMSNYTVWTLKMKVYRHKEYGIESKDPKVAVDDKTDRVALSMIYQGILEEILSFVAERKQRKTRGTQSRRSVKM